MLGGDGKVGEIDGEIRGLLVPRQTGSGAGEPGVAPTIDGVAAKLETAAVQGLGSSLLGALLKSGDVELPNGYMQYNSKLDIVAMNYQLECFTFKYLPMNAKAQPGDAADADKLRR
jgi:hypothetical protein